ncbi:MAG: hypothetical protein HY720_05525 [Planctomycetes bacterium]|nr:hypothetical protein [Planctomycetota bacterium]
MMDKKPPRMGRMVVIGEVRHLDWYVRMRRLPRIGRLFDPAHRERLMKKSEERDGGEGPGPTPEGNRSVDS